MPASETEREGQTLEPWETALEGKTAIIGLGNPYMRDDGVGLQAARMLRERRAGADIYIYEAQDMDLSLLWQFRGAKKVVILDALRSGQPPGTITVHAVVPGDRGMLQLPDLHAIQLYDMLDLAADSGLLPCPVVIVGVEPRDCGPGEGLTEEIEAAVPQMVRVAIREVDGGA